VKTVQIIVMRRWDNSWWRGLSSNALWRRVTTATTWRVPVFRSRHEHLKPGTRSPTPTVRRHVGWTTSASEDDERSRCLDSRSATSCRSSTRYDGAKPCRQRHNILTWWL